jgi:enoyl-CoA hydratase/carnithine racemase
MDRYGEIRYAVDGTIATVTLHRPERRNGYTIRMAEELRDAFDTADRDPAVRAVVLTGTGPDFTVGADLSGDDGLTRELVDPSAAPSATAATKAPGASAAELPDSPRLPDSPGLPDYVEPPAYQEPAGRCALRIFEMSKPVIAAMRGAAVGAGSTIVLPADYRLAGTDTRFGFVFTRRGIVPEGASAWFLPRLVGLGRAVDWMVSGRVFGAEEALAAGLVHRVYEPDQVLDRAYELATELVETTAPVAVAVTRQLLFRMSALDSPYPVDRLDSRLVRDGLRSPDAFEGVTSFLQRRPPNFPGSVPADLPDYLPWLPK